MKTYYNRTLGIKVVASCREEAIKVMAGTAKITVDTGIKKPLDVKGLQILNEVLKDMPTSKTNGAVLKSVRGKVILEIDPKKNDYFASDLDKCLFHLAKNLKRIVKKSCAWVRNGKEVVKELSSKGKANLVSDCYKLYDILMERKTDKFVYANAKCLGAYEYISKKDFEERLKKIAEKYGADFESKIRERYSHYMITFDNENVTKSIGHVYIKVDEITNEFSIGGMNHGRGLIPMTVGTRNACLKYVDSYCNKISKG